MGKTLKIDKDKQFLVQTNDIFDPVLKAIKKYSAHPRILSIKEKMNNNVFSFRKVTYEEILNEINSLDTSKSTQSEDIRFNVIKDNADIFVNYHNDKTKYRPVSILPSTSKIYERLIFNQITQMTENTLSIFQCGFGKEYSTQHALIAMLKRSEKSSIKVKHLALF